jgi:serine/threonine protein kinase/Tfp pilus assembly protein PilF
MKCPKCHSDNPDDTIYCGKCATPLKSAEEISITKTLITPPERLQKSSTVGGRYTIIEELGRGGMGVVYKAEDTKLKRTVALKFLPSELTHISEVKDRFMREAQAAAALDHPNICTVHEVDEAEEKTFISMAYVEGQSLKKKIESGPLELDEALRIATKVAEGLEEAHKKGVIHRDIKSANIMVTEKGRAMIMDFGLARMIGETLLTKEGMTMGTIAYMSPEQARGEEVDPRTDIWSFGVVLYEMLSGQLPFKGEHDQAVVYSILNKKIKPLTDLKAEIPMSLEQVVSKALEKNPDKRYQHIEELLDDLRSISEGIVPEEIRARVRKAKLLSRKRSILYAGAAGLIIIIAVIAMSLFTGRAEAIDSIAVLPLENLSGDPEQEYFADAMTEELITNLAKISALKVISRTSMMQYKGTKKPLLQIAKELNVDALIEGSVLSEGGQVRITAQLIQAATEQNLWAESYRRDLRGVLALQGEIASAIADKVRAAVTPTERARLASARPVNPEAYEAYLKGMQHWYRLTPEDLDAAREYFELALKKDPNYASAYAGIAFVWIGREKLAQMASREAWPKAKAAALKALELDSTLAQAHSALAIVKGFYEWDWAGAEAEFKRAIELNPNYPDVHSLLSQTLMFIKRPEEAMAHIQRALELDPFNAMFQAWYGVVLRMGGRDDEALAQFRKALRTSPRLGFARSNIARTLFYQGKYADCLAEFKVIWGNSELLRILDQGFAQSDYRGAMRRVGDIVAKRSSTTGLASASPTYYYLMAGEKERTLEWLEKAFEAHDGNLPYIVSRPNIDPLRSDPRFQDLLRKMNLPMDEKE